MRVFPSGLSATQKFLLSPEPCSCSGATFVLSEEKGFPRDPEDNESCHSISRNRLLSTCSFGLFLSAIEPALKLADAHRVLGLGLLDADSQAGCWAEEHVRESAAPELGEREHSCFVD